MIWVLCLAFLLCFAFLAYLGMLIRVAMGRPRRRYLPHRAEVTRVRNAPSTLINTHFEALAALDGLPDAQDKLNAERLEWWRGRRLEIPYDMLWLARSTGVMADILMNLRTVHGALEVNHLWQETTVEGQDGVPTLYDPLGQRPLRLADHRHVVSGARDHVLLPWHRRDWPTTAEVLAKGARR